MHVSTQNIITAFENLYQATPQHIVRAPGRVNLIGEHTDYNLGFVLPCAIDCFTWIALSKTDSQNIHVQSINFSQTDTFTLEKPIAPHAGTHWSNYIRGIVDTLQKQGFTLGGFNCCIWGNVPQGAGLSSSASLSLALLKALDACFDLQRSNPELARLGQIAENDFVGCQCGIMDQLVISCATENAALQIDCRSLETTPVPIAKELGVFVVHSGIKRGLVTSEYNIRRRQCEQAAEIMHLDSLRDASLDLLQEYEQKLGPLLFKRAHHVVSENARTLAASQALQKNDTHALSRLMAASHASMRDDFEITCPEIDTLVDLLTQIVGTAGGVRMTGGGFGGCVIALVQREKINSLIDVVEQQYSKVIEQTPWYQTFLCTSGTHRIDPNLDHNI